MKSLIYVSLALVAMVASATSASAADNQVSSSSLNAAGLPGFAPMSDAQGMGVRGKFAAVGGLSIATARCVWRTATSPSVTPTLQAARRPMPFRALAARSVRSRASSLPAASPVVARLRSH